MQVACWIMQHKYAWMIENAWVFADVSCILCMVSLPTSLIHDNDWIRDGCIGCLCSICLFEMKGCKKKKWNKRKRCFVWIYHGMTVMKWMIGYPRKYPTWSHGSEWIYRVIIDCNAMGALEARGTNMNALNGLFITNSEWNARGHDLVFNQYEWMAGITLWRMKKAFVVCFKENGWIETIFLADCPIEFIHPSMPRW